MLTNCLVFYFRHMIKRIASLFLIVTLFYNVLGYYLLYHQQEEQKWVTAMETLNHSNYKILKLNASIYTFIEDTDFEYVNQNIEINNKFYHIFKKRIQNNILYLYYLPNTHQNKINKDLKTIVNGQLFDDSSSKDSSSKKIFKTFMTDYVLAKPIVISNTVVFSFTKKATHEPTPIAKPICGYFNLPFSPPDVV